MKEIRIEDLTLNPFTKIGKEAMLINAVDSNGNFNPMTASWGGLGVLWNKNVAFCFIRPQRYTDKFAKDGENVSLCFLGKEHKDVMRICGTKSGRDIDKVAECALTPVNDDGYVYFEESELVLFGKKLYCGKIEESAFFDNSLLSNYAQKDYHFVYVYEITKVLM